MKKLLLGVGIVMSFLNPSSSYAQTSIQGKVVDSQSHFPIRHCSIILVQKDSIVGIYQSNSAGYFLIDSIANGNYRIEANAYHYEAAVYSGLKINDQELIQLEIPMLHRVRDKDRKGWIVEAIVEGFLKKIFE